MKKIVSFLKTDVKIINSYFLVAIILVILISVGYSSYALFSFTKTSNNIIDLTVGKIVEPNIEPETFNYVEGTNYYTYIAKANGYYNLDVYGAQGGSYNESYATGGLGGYSKGIVKLKKGDMLYIYVGGKGGYGTSTTETVVNGGGYNGGGNASYHGGAGGGASDIRYFLTKPTSEDLKWNSTLGLNSRLIVAGGGGGAKAYSSSYKAAGGSGGGLSGANGSYYSSYSSYAGSGASATSGGTDGTAEASSSAYSGKPGTFGIGGDTGRCYSTNYISNGAGGGGFYGGGAADNYTYSNKYSAGGGGGSGYVWTSDTASNYTSTNLPSSMYLTSSKTTEGVNTGNGKVIISYLSKEEKVTVQSKEKEINIDPSVSALIKSYFNIYEIGATLSKFECKVNDEIVEKTDDLYYGKNVVNCIATDSNNKTSEDKITINILGTFAQTLLAADSLTPVKASTLESRIIAKNTPDFSIQEPSFTWKVSVPTKTNTYNLSSSYTSRYIIVADDFEFDGINNKYTLKGNVKAVLYNTSYQDLINKYTVSYYPNLSNNTINSTSTYSNKGTIYKITNTTYDSSSKTGVITYLQYNNRNNVPDVYDSSKSGIYSATDNYGTTYYYRGDIKNNYVSFAGFYWRIIRINGNGSIRLLYAGKISDVGSTALENGSRSSLLSISTLAFNTSHNNYYYVGLKYSTSSYHGYNTASNILGSTSKTGSLYYWYYNNIQTNYNSYISDTLFCANRDYEKDEYNDINYDADPENPKLVCNTKTDRFTKQDSTNGTATLTYPIGLITLDEIIMGGVGSSGNTERMYQKSYTSGPLAWTMTPCYYRQDSSDSSYNHSCIWIYGQSTDDTNNSDCNVPDETLAVRPVINLIPNVTFTGTGTANDPYVITGIK